MSSTLFQESRVTLAELLLSEKDATRVWLRAEIDRAVDPMLDSIFDRLNNKLANVLERTLSGEGDCGSQVGNASFSYQFASVPQPFTFIPQPSPSTHLSSPNPTSFHFHPQYVQSQFTSHASPVPPPLPVSIASGQITLPNELTVNGPSSPMPNKLEIRTNEAMIEDHFAQSLQVHIENEQSNQNVFNLDDDEEEDCDCDDCVNGAIEGIKQEDDESDSVEWIEDKVVQEQSSRPVKKPRIDSDPTPQNTNAQPEVVRQCSRRSTQPNQVNHQDKQIITLHFQCTQSDCFDTFPEYKLNQHMLEKHDIGPFRCLVKDCAQSFENKSILSQHLKQSHQHTTQWHCNKCPKLFTSYRVLSSHNIVYHQLGHFQCSFPSCTFTGEFKQKVYTHYVGQHKPDFVCQQSGCNFRTKDSTHFKDHRRAHLGIKPYRCKWPNCDYSHASRNTTLVHIKTHFNPKASSSNVAPSGKPTDYLEIVHSLL